MNRIFTIVLLAGTVVLSSGCSGDVATTVDLGTIAEQVYQADQGLLRAEEQRDLEGAMGFIAPHAVFQPPGLTPIMGLEAIRRFYDEQWFELPFVEIHGEPDTIIVASSGDMAYLDGRSDLVLEVSGERVVSEGNYLGVWRKLEGQWRLSAISWSANAAGN